MCEYNILRVSMHWSHFFIIYLELSFEHTITEANSYDLVEVSGGTLMLPQMRLRSGVCLGSDASLCVFLENTLLLVKCK